MTKEPEFKTRKLSEEEHDVLGENLLCKLPEALLQHILSLLPTQQAVRTSVLSTRWKYLWTSIPSLEFECFTCKGKNTTTLVNFVDRALSLRNIDIKKFTLSTNVVVDQARICWWISALVWRNVQSITISLNWKNALELPDCLFTCASLRDMHLDMSILKLPTSVRLSNLKTLQLSDITFPDSHSTQKLFSSCPVLEELTIYKCNWKNIDAVNICYPKLWRLSIDAIEVNSLTLVEEHPHGCPISIFGSCLRWFYYSGDLENEYFVYDSSLLDEAWVQVENSDQRTSILANRLYKLLNGLRDAKKLILPSTSIEILDFAPEVLPYLPVFKNLSTLEFNLDTPVNLHQDALLKLLENCPCLKALEFSAGIEVSSDVEVRELLKPIPSCFSSTLRRIDVDYFEGNKELCVDVVEMLLSRAAILQNLGFYYHGGSEWSKEESNNFIDEIQKLPRASAVVDIKLF